MQVKPKKTEKIYLHLTKDNDKWLRLTAKHFGWNNSDFINQILDTARKGGVKGIPGDSKKG